MVRATALIGIALLLPSCEKIESTEQKASWAEDQAAANFGRINTLEARIEELEGRLEELDSRENKITDAAIQDISGLNDEIDRLSRNDSAAFDNLNYLRALHGRPPIPEK